MKPAHACELGIERLSLATANNYVTMFHRHNKPVQGHKFSLGLLVVNSFWRQCVSLDGAAIVGRPVARRLDDGDTLEVRRVVIAHNVPNGCSYLLGWCRRIAKRSGYKRLITYTLESESGVSLRAAGWKPTGTTKGGSWSNASRPRIDKHDLGPKIRWEAPL